MSTQTLRRSRPSHAVRLAGLTAAASLTGFFATSTASAESPPTAVPEARIAFANHGGIDDWQADGDRALYVRDIHRRWYRATLLGSCIDLPFAQHVGFVSEPTGAFDRFSAIVVRGQKCMLTSLTASDGPPSKAKVKVKANPAP